MTDLFVITPTSTIEAGDNAQPPEHSGRHPRNLVIVISPFLYKRVYSDGEPGVCNQMVRMRFSFKRETTVPEEERHLSCVSTLVVSIALSALLALWWILTSRSNISTKKIILIPTKISGRATISKWKVPMIAPTAAKVVAGNLKTSVHPHHEAQFKALAKYGRNCDYPAS